MERVVFITLYFKDNVFLFAYGLFGGVLSGHRYMQSYGFARELSVKIVGSLWP